MKNLPNNIEEKIQEHLNALKIESIGWIGDGIKVANWEEKEMVFFGDPFLEVQLDTGVKLEFSYKPSEGTEYCLCDKHSENYNHIHSCCGDNCDWEIPMVTKYSPDGSEEIYVFTGKQNELWK